jgi:uncharacterized protein with HEPN domain
MAKISSKSEGGRSAFEADEMLQVWVRHHLQVIGEAARGSSPEFKLLHPDDVWRKAAGMRHILVHHYFEIEMDDVWNVVEHDLPALSEKISQILGL